MYSREQNTVDQAGIIQIQVISSPLLFAGSLGDLDGVEENTPDSLSLSGEEGGISDPEDSAEGDSSSPQQYTQIYNEGERRKTTT